MINPLLSDLFFNHQHPNYDTLFQEEEDTFEWDEAREAIEKDAKQFYECFGEICNQYGCEDHQKLADDFMKRV